MRSSSQLVRECCDVNVLPFDIANGKLNIKEEETSLFSKRLAKFGAFSTSILSSLHLYAH